MNSIQNYGITNYNAFTFRANEKPLSKAAQKAIASKDIINKIIPTNVPGQNVLITSDLADTSQFIATFFNNGIPSTPTRLPIEKLSYFISNLK